MRKFKFVPLEEKAKALGLSVGAFRAHILTENEMCWIYTSNLRASCFDDDFLPAYDPESSSFARWDDQGSSIDKNAWSDCRFWGRYKIPSYRISGWVLLDGLVVERVLAGRETRIDEKWIHVYAPDASGQLDLIPLYAETGENEPVPLTQDDLYFVESNDAQRAQEKLDPRERTTLLCIIGALATKLKLDLAEPYKAAEAVAKMLPGDVKVRARTIGDHLKRVREAMDNRKD